MNPNGLGEKANRVHLIVSIRWKMKNSYAAALLIVLLVAGLGFGYFAGTMTSTSTTTTTVVSATTEKAPKYADVTITVIADLRRGSDNNTHDTFTPSNFTLYIGQTVNLTIVNYDGMPHSFTSPSLGVNFLIPGSTADGVPSVSHFQFTPTKTGVFRYWCAVPCDDWAMAIDAKDGQPGRIGYMGGLVTVHGV